MREETSSKNFSPGTIILIPSVISFKIPITLENISSFKVSDTRAFPGLGIVLDADEWKRRSNKSLEKGQIPFFLPGSEDFSNTPSFLSFSKSELLRAVIIRDREDTTSIIAILENVSQYLNGKSKYHEYLQYLKMFAPLFVEFHRNRRKLRKEVESDSVSQEKRFIFEVLDKGIPIFEHQS